MAHWETEVVIAGTGPGGATAARELAKNGLDVVMVEKGRWHKFMLGRYASFGTITRTIRPKQGGVIGRGISVGGSSVVYNGNAYNPPSWLGETLGADLSQETAETRIELGIRPLPDAFYDKWPATRRLAAAAADLDMVMTPQHKFIDPQRCDPGCDDCMLGCKRGAKWTAREYVTQAQRSGARLLDRTSATRLILENGKAAGIRVAGPGNVDEIRADRVILAAGGIGTPLILLRSGIQGAGENFFVDPMNVLYARSELPGPVREHSFSMASEAFVESDGYMFGNLGWMPLLPRAVIGRIKGNPYRHHMGMFTKIADSHGGRIHADGSIEKPYTREDMDRFDKSTEACRKIMIRAGAVPESIKVDTNIGGHPGGTAAIGRVVGRDLQTYAAKNLYVCDASVFPRSPGRPPTLTIIAMAKYLARKILT
jgi:choline dehydrogenase-like flavoprotein